MVLKVEVVVRPARVVTQRVAQELLLRVELRTAQQELLHRVDLRVVQQELLHRVEHEIVRQEVTHNCNILYSVTLTHYPPALTGGWVFYY